MLPAAGHNVQKCRVRRKSDARPPWLDFADDFQATEENGYPKDIRLSKEKREDGSNNHDSSALPLVELERDQDREHRPYIRIIQSVEEEKGREYTHVEYGMVDFGLQPQVGQHLRIGIETVILVNILLQN